jgi:undecaprenyl-diphosphatase
MNTVQTIFLGLLQGATEFLPVSSSAHLVAAERLLGTSYQGVVLEVALHFGTLVSIVIVLWKDLLGVVADAVSGALALARSHSMRAACAKAPLFPVALAIVVGSVPAGLAGVLLEDVFEKAFKNLTACGLFLMATGAVLFMTRFARRPRVEQVGPGRGFLIGLAQAIAILPGISRSGSTIAAGLLLGVERRCAGRFSFLLAVPALTGAALWEGRKVLTAAPGALPPLGLMGLGALTSAAVGTACLLLLLHVVERGRLHWFAAYCLPIGALMATWGWLS